MIAVTGPLFGAAPSVLIATPGQDMILVMSRAIAQEAVAGVADPTACVFVLGLAFASLIFLIKGDVGLAAGYLSGWLRGNPKGLATSTAPAGGSNGRYHRRT